MATIADVARVAGVSLSTVSYALSGKRPISPETRRRIQSAVAELGYRPHAGARALASAQTRTIGLMAPLRAGVDLNVVMQFVSGIAATAHSHEYDVLLVTHGDESDVARVTSGSMVDALVVMDVEADDPRLRQLRNLEQPVVLIGLPGDTEGLSCIDFDFGRAGALGAQHLIDLGHREIALLGAPPEVLARHTSYAERMNSAFAQVAVAAGVGYRELSVPSSMVGAQAAVAELLGSASAVTGVLVHNEIALPHIVAGLVGAGRSIPDDISVIAVGPENVALSLPRPLTSIDLPAERIGRIAVEMVLAQLSDEGKSSEVRLLGPTLTDRGTTVAPRTT
ncbi:LacI family DNA-binding transcriptional regulator [Compostimonas suwonensis]|uniref:DNA-binding LacI/PurR family transcriptional regulator n=1 Tax=Compostimonas suwonensis TaxID=1048394 RepID=A0A2M9BCW1_9MICO|nr:LacI family DNA-binding transcriptional regulator [Compostimonas suwonensis]PJJ55780.1 DNA-binding LacI/PurR family transcriptional regulator [Compostimonas suwonensis]